MVVLVFIVIICAFIIVYHLYKIKDDLDTQLKDLRYHQNYISLSIERIEQSLYQIDAIVSDIADDIEKLKKK